VGLFTNIAMGQTIPVRGQRHAQSAAGPLHACPCQPLYKLFGGAFRKLIPFFYYIPDKEIGEMAAETAQGVKKGFNTIYLKLRNDADHNVQVVAAVRQAI